MYLRTTIVLIYFFVLCHSKLKPMNQEHIKEGISLSQCIATASEGFFESKSESITYHLPPFRNNERDDIKLDFLILQELYHLGTKDIFVKNFDSESFRSYQKQKPVRFCIFEFRDEREIQKKVSKLKETTPLNSHLKFLLVSMTVFSQPFQIAQNVSRYLWHENIMESMIIIPKPRNRTHFLIYVYDPYGGESCSYDSKNFIHPFDVCSFGEVQSNISWIQKKSLKSFQNCTLRVRYQNHPPFVFVKQNRYTGVEVQILNTIADRMKLNFSYRTSTRDRSNEVTNPNNKTSVNVFESLMKKDFDIAIGGYPKICHISMFFDYSHSYMYDNLNWCVPALPRINGLENLIELISFHILVGILFLYITVTVIIWYLSMMSDEELPKYKNLMQVFMNLFRILAGSTVPRLPQTYRVRYFIFLFLIFCFYFNFTYTSLLMRNLTRPIFRQKYESLKDIYNDNLETYFFPGQEIYFEKETDGVPLSTIKARWKICENITLCLANISVKKDSSICISKIHRIYIKNHQNLPGIYCFKDKVTHPVGLILRKGLPILDMVDDTLLKLLSGGIFAKWKRDLLASGKYRTLEIESPRIKLKHLSPVLFLHCITLTAASFVFIMELMFHN
ncbi:uncharacterized protein [Leptinotarsa decemlineata]|uniref:uncharacterized protein n=1 Tax=Leptinotarsa decemlineata TaxID=7539 RepID=UPI003D30BD6C